MPDKTNCMFFMNTLSQCPCACRAPHKFKTLFCCNQECVRRICILHGFPCEMDFSHLRIPLWWDSETCGEKSISHGKPYKMHFLAYFTLQGALIMLNTLRKVEDHENHVRLIYFTIFLNMGDSRKYARRACIQPTRYIEKSQISLELMHG